MLMMCKFANTFPHYIELEMFVKRNILPNRHGRGFARALTKVMPGVGSKKGKPIYYIPDLKKAKKMDGF